MSAALFFAAACYLVFGVGFAADAQARKVFVFDSPVMTVVAFVVLALLWPLPALLFAGARVSRWGDS